MDWDDILPEPLLSSWGELTSQMSIVQSLIFPRFVIQSQASVEMHRFCDASTAAYGACLYLRSEANGNAEAHLLCAKSRVAPLKALTIPRLELSAACLLAELIENVKETIGFDCSFHCWSDSSIVLARIRQPPREFNVFVSNRIAKIQEMTKGMAWHYVPTDLNPADVVHIAVEYEVLSQGKPCPPKSKLISLGPILSSEGLLRVGGRLQNASLDYEAKHPILLPKDHPVTRAIIVYYHEKYFHVGPQALLAALRQRYWPIGGLKFVASVINKCVRCFRMKPVAWEHVMGSLPADRVQPNPAFHTTGVAYCEPFYHKSEARNKAPQKCYIAVFVCFSTKAAYLEVVQDLTTDSFIAALSDNAKNFVGAKRELAELKELF
ncbi:uncharacterized protein LOC128263919 [Drosophila gunungcola]|uniref:uncharacterized protein LOC128263919 n=1 Tax=Drosophila gunungcola TaxID=103775 RepID=UPI0022E899FA|nr:uncharacterized protein LOC128263919 [Drosophila gunungcola]